MKVLWVNSVCEGMGEMNSTRAGRRSSLDPRMKTNDENFIIPGQNSSRLSRKLVFPHGYQSREVITDRKYSQWFGKCQWFVQVSKI